MQAPTPAALDAFWMPFTANRKFKRDPRFVTGAQGMHYTMSDGSQVLDGIAGLWCVNAGHRHPAISAALKQQIDTLDYASNFQLGHPAAFTLAERLADWAPADLNRVFFTNSGSESVDTALKIALAWHRARGDAGRYRLIGRARAYHGVGFGGISVAGIAKHRNAFGPLLNGVDHLPHTHDPKRNAFSRGEPLHGVEHADALEAICAVHDPATIAAVIVEPIAGSTGVLPPPVGYLTRLREICDRHGILLIFDEVITGFGRLGARFAADRFGVVPDLMATAKGLTNGAIPMGAVFVREAIHAGFMQGSEAGVEFAHGYTYSGHPLACAAALATLQVHQEEDLAGQCAAIAPYFEDVLHALRGEPAVADVRNLGLLGAVELSPFPGRPGVRAQAVERRCLEQGLLVRALGETIAVSPPLVVSRDQLAGLAETLRAALRHVDAAGPDAASP
ncbi:aminotransferase class III-fold pyridoxal phosphate-dependent enzyme [Xylophilus rhododendri]|uniref:Aminotransferase class III-fold pyridoxal phosphate-dependent enzyme n=1 Tax=Xylophilus rhododendri TaxID=2697032 RepID=A0A857JBL1_9BURK|nr:aspartate aminotransferase family protein [Xylophilus rhododendri]QHJ00614.1 aminotransferase class III-fold pyridoxal phosphate-dependent enzyme [Xylophilus rhododendri]